MGNMTGDLNNKTKGKKNIIDLLNFTKDTLSVLQQKETLINDYIIEIENNEENVNKKLINDISDRKQFNKRKKLMQLKIKQEQNENNKRLKAIERAQRVIIKGRKVPQEYPIIKRKKNKKIIIKEMKMIIMLCFIILLMMITLFFVFYFLFLFNNFLNVFQRNFFFKIKFFYMNKIF